jgi:hypothetical protein
MSHPYKLTLTKEERKAIDWIGNRYPHGHDLYRLLWIESKVENESCINPWDLADWGYDEDITFLIPESVAWEIDAMGLGSCYKWDCFSDELVIKLNAFCGQLV